MFKEVANFPETNKEFLYILELIEIKTKELEDSREIYLFTKAKYENDYLKKFIEIQTKNSNMTQREVEAQTIILSYENNLELIKLESKYRRLQNEVRCLRDRLDSLKEISYNLRRENVLK